MFGIERKAFLAIVMVAFGYFIDLFDLFAFSVTRVASLTEIMGPGVSIQAASEMILTAQLVGLVLGGFLWGVLSDKIGRRAGLLGAGAVFTLATFANAFVHDPVTYALCRFIAGIGLSAEIGLAFVLAGELVTPRQRGWVFMGLAFFGTSGATVASIAAMFLPWRDLYILAAGLGAVIFLGRAFFLETPLFKRLAEKTSVTRGSLMLLFRNPPVARRYLASLLIGFSLAFSSFFLSTFAPEIMKGMGHPAPIKPPVAIFWYVAAACVGDILWGAVGQFLRSRRRVLFVNAAVFALCMALFFSPWAMSLSGEVLYFLLGLAIIPPTLFYGIISEQFGTNLRATTTSSAQQVVRGVLVTLLIWGVSFASSFMDYITAVRIAVALVVILSFVGILGIRETFEADLEYEEADSRRGRA